MNNEIGTTPQEREWFEKQVIAPELPAGDLAWRDMYQSRTEDFRALFAEHHALFNAFTLQQEQVETLKVSAKAWKGNCLETRLALKRAHDLAAANWVRYVQAGIAVEQFDAGTERETMRGDWRPWVALVVLSVVVIAAKFWS